VRIDVELASTAAAGDAAAELARILRQVTGRLEAARPTPSGTLALAAWLATWATLRSALLDLAVAAEAVAIASRAAVTSFRHTENEVIAPDGH
jgi:hypothetical protein